MSGANGRVLMRNPVPGPGGGTYVSELQRTRLLDATFAVVAEQGYRGMAVRAVTERAGVSSKTFYDLFEDREDCFLAAFDYGVQRLAACVGPAYEGEEDWVAGIRAGLGVLLGVLDREPALSTLLFAEAFAAGTRVLERRAEVLGELARVLDRGREGAEDQAGLSALTAEGVVGAVFGVIHVRLLQPQLGPLSGLLNELMASILLPYRGRDAAARELRRTPTSSSSSARKNPAAVNGPAGLAEGQTAPLIGSLKPVDFRLTVRTQTVLAAVAELNGRGSNPNNQEISKLAGISDQGQISRMMMRLADEGLAENTSDRPGHSKAWRLSAEGQDVIRANPPLRPEHTLIAQGLQRRRSVGSPARKKGQAERRSEPAFRLTDRTQLVLAAVAELGTRDLAPSNREISQAAGVTDQGQISKLLRRLESRGLLQNTGGATQGIPNAWRLTRKGEEILSLSPDHASLTSPRQETPR